MSFGFDNLEAFVDLLHKRGYKREKNRSIVKPHDDQWWLAVGRNGDRRNYTVVVRIYDHTPYLERHTFSHPYGAAFSMLINHTSEVDVESLELRMEGDGLTLEAFEERCKRLYTTLVDLWPRLDTTNPLHA